MQVPQGLPNCLDLKESQRADCYLASTSDRGGFVVYSNYRGCLNSWLAVPGFMLLPTWALASKFMVSSSTAGHTWLLHVLHQTMKICAYQISAVCEAVRVSRHLGTCWQLPQTTYAKHVS